MQGGRETGLFSHPSSARCSTDVLRQAQECNTRDEKTLLERSSSSGEQENQGVAGHLNL